jgi:hypothetical protein
MAVSTRNRGQGGGARTGDKKERVQKRMQRRKCKKEWACIKCKRARQVYEGDGKEKKAFLQFFAKRKVQG